MLLRTSLAMFLGVFAVEIAAAADFSSELIGRGKRATALVIQESGRVFGSAFCIDDAGLFVTNAHVVGERTNEDTTLVINSGARGERLVKARVLRVDRQRDLALLHAADATDLTSLPLGVDAKLFETQSVAAFGYPYGTALARKGMHPSISVNIGRVTALRRQDDALHRIQFDAQVNPGNSGGPLVDQRGNVIGVVASGIVNSGLYMAIPVSELRDWLRDPIILVEPREIQFDRRHEEILFAIKVVTAGRNVTPKRIELSLGEEGRTLRMQEAKVDDHGKYAVAMQPISPPAADRSVHVSAMLKEGYIRGYTANRKLMVGQREIELSEIRRIERDGDQWRISTSKDGEFAVDSLPPVTIRFALDDATKASVELSRISQFVVYPSSPVTRVDYRVAVSFADAETVVHRGQIPLVGVGAELVSDVLAPAAASRVPTPPQQPAAGEKGDVVVRLPAKYASFTMGAQGRYVLFQLAEKRKVLVFDVIAGRVVQEIPGISSSDLMAAGADKLFVVSPDAMMVQRFSLQNFQREETARIEGEDPPVAIHIGAASAGPLLLQGSTVQLLNAESLRPIASRQRLIGATGRYGYAMHVSADGRTFSGIVQGIGPVSYEVMQFHESRRTFASFGSTSQAIRWAHPTADGALLLLPGGGVFNGNGRQIQAAWLDGGSLVPTLHPAYFLDVRLGVERPDGEKSSKLTVCTVADCRPIYTEWGFDELLPERMNSWHDIVAALRAGNQWRIQYAPWTKTIVTLPSDNERVLLRPFDLEAKVNAEDAKYLYVLSTPPLEATKGEAMRYHVQLQSNGGDVACALEDGPDGAVVSRDGMVVWDVPGNYADPWARFIVSVRDEAEQEIFHSFEVAVRESATAFRTKE